MQLAGTKVPKHLPGKVSPVITLALPHVSPFSILTCTTLACKFGKYEKFGKYALAGKRLGL